MPTISASVMVIPPTIRLFQRPSIHLLVLKNSSYQRNDHRVVGMRRNRDGVNDISTATTIGSVKYATIRRPNRWKTMRPSGLTLHSLTIATAFEWQEPN